jgi:hypothetical protein
MLNYSHNTLTQANKEANAQKLSDEFFQLLTGGRDLLVVRNLPTLSIEVTSLEASSSNIPPQGAGGSSKPVDWEPIVLAYHNRELLVPTNMRMRVTFCM